MKKILYIFIIIIVISGVVFYFENKIVKKEVRKPNTVIIDKYLFQPGKLTVKKGTTVTWTNNDIAKHTVTADDGDSSGLNTELFGKNKQVTFTFNTVGTFHYHCDPHPYMHGSIEVTE